MRQQGLNTFWVDPGEVVTITIEAHGVAETVAASKDHAALNPIKTGPLTYQFTVTAPRGASHFTTFEYVFPGGPEDDADFVGTTKKFVTKISASGNTFDGPTVTPETIIKAQDITFNVRNPGTDFDFPTP